MLGDAAEQVVGGSIKEVQTAASVVGNRVVSAIVGVEKKFATGDLIKGSTPCSQQGQGACKKP